VLRTSGSLRSSIAPYRILGLDSIFKARVFLSARVFEELYDPLTHLPISHQLQGYGLLIHEMRFLLLLLHMVSPPLLPRTIHQTAYGLERLRSAEEGIRGGYSLERPASPYSRAIAKAEA
jgi:hypothetical protein